MSTANFGSLMGSAVMAGGKIGTVVATSCGDMGVIRVYVHFGTHDTDLKNRWIQCYMLEDVVPVDLNIDDLG